MRAPAKLPVISERSLVPISIVGGALLFVMSGTWFVAGFKNDISALASEVRELRQAVNDRTSDTVSSQDMKVWCRLLARSNASLQVPDWIK